MDAPRIQEYMKDLHCYRKRANLSRLDVENRISRYVPNIQPPRLESFFEWLDGMTTMDGLEHASPETLMHYLRRAQEAKHDYVDLLNAAFCTEAEYLQKWVSIIFKLGRYAIASRAFCQLAVEIPALFNPMVVSAISSPDKVSVPDDEVDLGQTLRRLFGTQEKEYIRRLSHIWVGKGSPRKYFLRQCPTRLTVHAELQLVGFYDANPQRMPSFRFIGVSKKSCYLCDRFLSIHPASFSTSACHQKLYSAWIPPPTVENKIYDRYKSIIINLTSLVEAAAKQELNRRVNNPHKLVPPDSSAGVSLTGLMEPGTASVMPEALVESQIGFNHFSIGHNAPTRSSRLESSGDIQSLCFSSRTADSIPQAEASEMDNDNKLFSHAGIDSRSPEPSNQFVDMVLHFKRVDDPFKQDIVYVAETFDNGSRKPSWKKLLEIVESGGELGVGFKTEGDVLVIENQMVVDSERQFLACLQYLRNADKLNAQAMVYKRTNVRHAANRSMVAPGAVRSRAKRRWKWANLGSILFRENC